MCATLTWPENSADSILEVLNSKIFLGGMPPHPPKRACFCTLTFYTLRSTIYVALPVPEQLPYSDYATGPVFVSTGAVNPKIDGIVGKRANYSLGTKVEV